jgi:hypothetical protein
MKIPVGLHEEIFAKAKGGATQRDLAAWLATKAIDCSHVAVGKLLRKHDAERRERSKRAVVASVEATLPEALQDADRRFADAGQVVDLCKAKVTENASSAAVDSYCKAASLWLRIHESRQRALGLESSEDAITDLASLLAKAG